jgi:hypothetical protein
MNLLRQPLFRLLRVNLASGSLVALLLVGGMWRGFVTFGSVVMGAAIMGIGARR